MPTLTVNQSLWNNLEGAARKKKKSVAVLARKALSEYLERLEDEELLESSSSAGRRAKFRIGDSEAIVRDYRSAKNNSRTGP